LQSGKNGSGSEGNTGKQEIAKRIKRQLGAGQSKGSSAKVRSCNSICDYVERLLQEDQVRNRQEEAKGQERAALLGGTVTRISQFVTVAP
jgi:hypothetical protein